jgi:RNA polymerase sigma factor (sigma-70 family)
VSDEFAAESSPAEAARVEASLVEASLVEATGSLPWASLFTAFFSPSLRDAQAASAVFARMIRFWLYRLGIQRSELCFEDLVQDVLLELTRSRVAIQEPQALGGWLRTTTIHKVQDRWRALQRQPPLAQAQAQERPEAPGLLPEAQVLQKEDRAELLQAIERLAPVLRDCIRLHLRGLSESEIAREIARRGHRARGSSSVERHNIKNWLHKARQELKRILSEMSDHG